MDTSPPERRRHSPLPLDDRVVAAILRHLPPDEPCVLARLSAVSKSWHKILTDPAFHRRYRDLHRTPPMLGFFFNEAAIANVRPASALFVPATDFSPRLPDRPGWSVRDARHGRVLLCSSLEFAIWNPISRTGRAWRLRIPGFSLSGCGNWQAAVLCAVDGCRHLDCHDGPFRVAIVITPMDGGTSHASTFSSETGMWSQATSVKQLYAVVDMEPSVLVGDTLYFPCTFGNRIVEYDMSNRRLDAFNSPTADRVEMSTLLMTAEGGGLGFAFVEGAKLHLWSMGEAAAAPGAGAMPEWSLTRIIDLDALPGIRGLTAATCVIGFADGVGVIFIRTADGVFTIGLRSGRVQRVTTRKAIRTAFPYMSFYSPDHALGRLPPEKLP